LAIDLNYLEQRKYNSDESAIKMAKVELAQHFSSLALLVKENAIIYMEVTLAAFSLQPTPERLNLLTELAVQTASDVTNQLRLLGDSTAACKADMTREVIAVEISFVEALNTRVCHQCYSSGRPLPALAGPRLEERLGATGASR